MPGRSSRPSSTRPAPSGGGRQAQPEFFRAVAASLGLPLAAVLVVGDDARTDVEGARAAGALGMLVRTGKFREADLGHPSVSPGLVIDSVADLPAALGL